MAVAAGWTWKIVRRQREYVVFSDARQIHAKHPRWRWSCGPFRGAIICLPRREKEQGVCLFLLRAHS